MKVIISEKQLANILGKKKVVDEIADTSATAVTSTAVSPSSPSGSASSAPSSPSSSASSASNDIGTSPGAADMPEYPAVDHWESGLVRGAANQVDTKSNWTDVVGSKLTRGHANPLR